MLEAGMVLHLRVHHGSVRRHGCVPLLIALLAALIVLIVIASALVRKVCWAFVLMRAAIVLEPPNYLIDIR